MRKDYAAENRARYASEPEYREHRRALDRAYRARQRELYPEGAKRRWKAWAAAYPDHAAEKERERRRRPDIARKLAAKAALRNKGIILTPDTIEAQALIVEIKREVQKLSGDPRLRNLEKIKQRYRDDPEHRERKIAYCRAWRERKKTAPARIEARSGETRSGSIPQGTKAGSAAKNSDLRHKGTAP